MRFCDVTDQFNATPHAKTLIDDLIAEQPSLTAVSRFSARPERHEFPAQARYYRDLIPLQAPRPGQQYAFEVDLDKCSGCKACVTACHSLNGLDDHETWRSVGLLHGGTYLKPLQRTVTTACHHCVDPACLNGCPVLAYEKDAATGIVRHLDDQCIGCAYCVLKCPYEVPQYLPARGIVRKSDMCSDRLAAGEAPACVQACPSEAIRIALVEKQAVVQDYREPESDSSRGEREKGRKGEIPLAPFLPRPPANTFLPGSPDPRYTLPTTRYKSAAPLHESLRPADEHELTPQPAHAPLGAMLVLSQLSAGAFAWERMLPHHSSGPLRPALTLTATVVGLLALATSTLHLGRPWGAWRAFLGLRRSWLSREIVVFGLFIMLAILHTAAVWFPSIVPASLHPTLGWATAGCGLLGVCCSAMIYHDTHRDFWRLPRSGGKFLGTTVLLGSATTLFLAACFEAPLLQPAAALVFLSGAAKFGLEWSIFRRLEIEDWSPLYKTALLLEGQFGLVHRVRVACGLTGAIALPAWLLLNAGGASPSITIGVTATVLLLNLAGEGIERRLFFTAVQPVKMPGA